MKKNVLTFLWITGSFLLVASPVVGLTDEAMDALVKAHLADEFTTQDVVRLVELKVDSDHVIKEIAYRVSKNVDVTFPISDADLDRIKRTGASNELIEALRSPISAVRFDREHPANLPAANTGSPVQFTSEEGGYSLEYPAQPEKRDLGVQNARGSLYIVASDNVIYASACTIYNQDIDPEHEMQADATGVAEQMHAKVTQKKSTRFIRAPGDELPALETIVESDKALGRCLSVVDRRRSYAVCGFAVKPNNGEAAIDHFLKSFKLASSAAGGPRATAAPPSESSPISTSGASLMETANPNRSLVSLSAGATVVNNAAGYDDKWASLWLLDENPKNGWCAPKGATTNQVIIIELPEMTMLKNLVFDTGSVDGTDGRGAKDILVEMSNFGENDGFQKIADVSLQDKADNQTFPVTAEVPGRWVRLTIKNNHGAPDYTELMDFRATGTQLTHTPLQNVSGTYATNYKAFHIRQEGTSVTGCYEHKEGLLEGGMDGRASAFTWTQSIGKGSATIVFASNGTRMTGIWWYADDPSNRGTWFGTKESSEVGSCAHWSGGIQNQLGDDLEKFGRARVYGINFDTDSDQIKDESKPTLDKIVALLRAKSDWKLSIEGHTDSTSTPQHNQGLSERRAASVKNYLMTTGIEGARLTTIGYGQSKPVASNDNPIGRAQNRRVELVKQ